MRETGRRKTVIFGSVSVRRQWVGLESVSAEAHPGSHPAALRSLFRYVVLAQQGS